MRSVRRVLAGGVALALGFSGWRFAALNSQDVALNYVFGEVPKVALWLALVYAFAAGFICAALFGVYQVTKQRLLARRYRKAVSGLEAEVHELRTLPLAPSQQDSAGDAQERSEFRLPSSEGPVGRSS